MDLSGVIVRFVNALRFWQRPSKHAAARRKGANHRRDLRARRKRQRQARRYSRLCASGRKHRWKGAL